MKKDFKLNIFHKGAIIPFNLYTTKKEALKNENSGNNDCLAVFWNGEVLYLATNNKPDYPEPSVLKFRSNGKIRYVHTHTIVPASVMEYRSITVYANPNTVNQYGSAQAAYDAGVCKLTPFTYSVPRQETVYTVESNVGRCMENTDYNMCLLAAYNLNNSCWWAGAYVGSYQRTVYDSATTPAYVVKQPYIVIVSEEY